MAKRADSVVGIDLGKHLLKGVALRRKNDSRFILTSFASRPVPEEFDSAEDLSRELKQLLCDLGGSAKACAFAVSDPNSWGYTSRPNLAAAQKEHDAFVALLQASGVDVRFHDVPQSGRADAIFVHDPAIVTERGANIRVVTVYDLDASQRRDYLERRVEGE